MKRVIVIQVGDRWKLVTRLGNPIGPRMVSFEGAPDLQDEFDKKGDAELAAVRWNSYLIGVDKQRSKTSRTRYAD